MAKYLAETVKNLKGNLLWEQKDFENKNSFDTFFSAEEPKELGDLSRFIINCSQSIYFVGYQAGLLTFNDVKSAWATITDESKLIEDMHKSKPIRIFSLMDYINKLEDENSGLAKKYEWEGVKNDKELWDALNSPQGTVDDKEDEEVAASLIENVLGKFKEEAMSKVPAEGTLIAYVLKEKKILSHHALSLGNGTLASLNGEGAHLSVISYGNLVAALPTILASAFKVNMEHLKDLEIQIFKPLWG